MTLKCIYWLTCSKHVSLCVWMCVFSYFSVEVNAISRLTVCMCLYLCLCVCLFSGQLSIPCLPERLENPLSQTPKDTHLHRKVTDSSHTYTHSRVYQSLQQDFELWVTEQFRGSTAAFDLWPQDKNRLKSVAERSLCWVNTFNRSKSEVSWCTSVWCHSVQLNFDSRASKKYLWFPSINT